jgi:hypothetical protein
MGVLSGGSARLHRWIAGCAIGMSLALVSAPLEAQTTSRPAVEAGGERRLELGPLAPLTTAWHPVPSEIHVPVGVDVLLRVRTGASNDVRWSGARALPREGAAAVAQLRLEAPETKRVSVAYTGSSGRLVEEALVLRGIQVPVEAIRVTGLRLTAEQSVLDPNDTNGSSMRLYFQGASIAKLRELGPGRYRTSIDRWVGLEAQVEPPELAPLVEWRVNGKAQRHLGSGVGLKVFTAGIQRIEAGAVEAPSRAELETYRVQIAAPDLAATFAEGGVVSYRAFTDPPGLEHEITWLASTKHGDCEPPNGQGAVFNVRFRDTRGLDGVWLGVRADNAVAGFDQKGQAVAEVVPSPLVGSLLGASGYEVWQPSLTVTQIDVLGPQGQLLDSVRSTYGLGGATQGALVHWTAVHSVNGVPDHELRVELLSMETDVDGVHLTTRVSARQGNDEVSIDFDTTSQRGPLAVVDRWNRARLRFGEAEFERSATNYEPSVDDPLFQQWLTETGAAELLGQPASSRLLTILADPALGGRSVPFQALNVGVATPEEFVANLAPVVDQAAPPTPAPEPDHGFWGTAGACLGCAACAETAWGGLFGCAACFAACAECGWGLGEGLGRLLDIAF